MWPVTVEMNVLIVRKCVRRFGDGSFAALTVTWPSKLRKLKSSAHATTSFTNSINVHMNRDVLF